MALLQIAEPGQSTAPHQHRIAIGIDLGTTHSLVATVLSGKPKVLQDDKDRVLLLLSFIMQRIQLHSAMKLSRL
jgi:molecular chaperone HscA